MPIPFIMPKFDMDQEEATVVTWMKNEGDYVKIDEPVLTVETMKVAIDVPSPASGTLVRISAQEGDTVPVTTVIAYILAEGETEDDIPVEKDVEKKKQISESAAPAGAKEPTDIHSRDSERQPSQKINRRVKIAATPLARKISKEKNIDLGTIKGSGPRGRIQAIDVQQVAAKTEQLTPDMTVIDMIPLKGIRRTIAVRLQRSYQEKPHFYTTVNVEVTRLLEIRKQMNVSLTKNDKQKISITAFLIKLVSKVLKANPLLNASIMDETIYLWKDINIGVATQVDDGLIVPTIYQADKNSVEEIGKELIRLTEKARNNTLDANDVQGGTFTVSNMGMLGIDQFTAIINPPQCAILAVGRIRKEFIPDENDRPKLSQMMFLTLSSDHRVVDGVVAAKFMSDLRSEIEQANGYELLR